MSVSVDCTAPKHIPTSLAMLRRSRLLSHITRVCTIFTFLSVVAYWCSQTVHILNALSSPLKLCCPFFSLCYKKETPSQGFPWSLHEFPWGAFLSYRSTWSLDNRSNYKFLHFANVSHPPVLKVLYIKCKQPSITACFSHSQCPPIR